MSGVPMDQRDGWIWYDGEVVPWEDAKVHVLTHGLHYASCVFEGQRAYGGEIFKLREHTDRLIASGKTLDFDLPYSADQIDDACREILAKNNLVNAYMRPVAWRGSEEMGVPARGNKVHVAIAAWEWPSYFTPEERLKGITLMWSKWKRPSPETIPCKAKAAGLYMICMLSKHAAIDGGYGDALMLDYRGYVAEATGANVFFVSGMREFLGAKNVSVPVSRLAKYKTTLQLIALAILLAEPMMPGLRLFSDLVLWLAAALTVWTGWSYWKGMAVHLKDAAK